MVHRISFKCRENFCGSHFICIEVLNKPITQKIHRESFRILSKIHENYKAFNFCHLRYIVIIIYHNAVKSIDSQMMKMMKMMKMVLLQLYLIKYYNVNHVIEVYLQSSALLS